MDNDSAFSVFFTDGELVSCSLGLLLGNSLGGLLIANSLGEGAHGWAVELCAGSTDTFMLISPVGRGDDGTLTDMPVSRGFITFEGCLVGQFGRVGVVATCGTFVSRGLW
jgi:hypothetical protein